MPPTHEGIGVTFNGLSQIVNLTISLSFGHNLCFKCPNGSCEHILDIYIPRDFQWCRKILNPMSFDSYNISLKIWESIGTLTPKMGTHLGMWQFIPSHPLTFSGAWNVIVELPFWPTPLQALALVTSPRLGLRHHCSFYTYSKFGIIFSFFS